MSQQQLPRLQLVDSAVNVPQPVLDRSDKANLNLMCQSSYGAPPTITVNYVAYVTLPNSVCFSAESRVHSDAVALACRKALEALHPTE